MTTVERAAPDWLALRRAADTEARDAGAVDLVERLVAELRDRAARSVRVVDVGAGTGANRAYLSPRLPFEQSWAVVDHDPELLADPTHGTAVRVEAGVCDLVAVLDDLLAQDPGLPTVLTCAALLDVLTVDELGCLADAIERSGAVALLSMSVTGGVHWDPPDPADVLVGGLFDAHQRRDGRPGPDAAHHLHRELLARGLEVHARPTPWLLDHRRPGLLERWLDERVAAALEQLAEESSERPTQAVEDPAQQVRDWRDRRTRQLRSAGLVAHVDHVDLLVLPH